jgi:site-specific DNA-methyltransferase (adenine-specific)
MEKTILHNGNCLDVLKTMEENSVDSIVTDPPYGINFMGKKWDYDVPSVEIWQECLRVLKPGGYLLAFSGTRTQHRMAVRIEDAGFEIRDMIAWVYGSGFPKSHNVSKAIDKTAKDDSKKWEGWGTALKPALEPITVARKPLEEKTVAENVLKYGTGAINIDESRVGKGAKKWNKPKGGIWKTESEIKAVLIDNPLGRFPANLIHDGSDEVTELFPSDKNSVARFFYVPKASKKDRNDGLESFEEKTTASAEFRPNHMEKAENGEDGNPYGRWTPTKNNHPTVKPTDLMRYLVNMVTPKGGTTLDPFMGSGSTGRGAMIGDFNFIGIELDSDYYEIAKARIEATKKEMTGWTSGLTAVDEDTYRKKVIEEEDLVRADKPALAAKDDLTSLEQRLERKLDSLRNMEKKVDTLLSLIYDNDAIVEVAKIVMPLLSSLYRTQNQEYIHWPGRGPIIQKQMQKVEEILNGSFFEEK